jgi:hypothetical protein
VTEVLQRIVGVTIDRTIAKNDPEHHSVEGSGVIIRGLSYVRSELNGRDSFSANGGRGLNFEDVPPELMPASTSTRNPSAERIEGAVSASSTCAPPCPSTTPACAARCRCRACTRSSQTRTPARPRRRSPTAGRPTWASSAR